MADAIRLTVDLTGILQGVGFRPTMARLVGEYGVGGWVRNQAGTVRLCLTGPRDRVERFLAELPARLPPQARLESARKVAEEPVPQGEPCTTFMILDSVSADRIRISIPPDLAMCDACRADVLDPDCRYHGYPFATCTNCGPRYTVIDAMPWDRDNTVMQKFPMCDTCRAEYEDPFSRRFHAETIACPACGPRLSLVDPDGHPVEGDPLRQARAALAEGKVIAVKGIGGFLLVADPFNDETIRLLRARKSRPAKPFAVMARNVEAAARYCVVDKEQVALMRSSKAPIAILGRLPPFLDDPRFERLAPVTGTLGIMLPTTPLHLLLAEPLPGDPVAPFELLLMTSGNRGGEPICLTLPDALAHLAGIADLFLTHDRDIHFRCDDAIVMHSAGQLRVLRRARGFAPRSLRLPRALAGRYLAFGADLKNTVALGFRDEIAVSPHIGDLEAPTALDGAAQVADAFPAFFKEDPRSVIVDLHPDMHAVRLGEAWARQRNLPVHRVQHHHAHAAACMAEYGLEDALGLVLDGTGWGPDGHIWGAELLHVVPGGFVRLGTFDDVPLPGGDAAVRRPARQLLARWFDAGVAFDSAWMARLGVGEDECEAWRIQCARGINAPRTHAAGRVFDAFSVLAGTAPLQVTWEGEAAVALEAAARRAGGDSRGRAVPFSVRQSDRMVFIGFREAFASFAEASPDPSDGPALALAFHRAVVDAGCVMVEHGRAVTGCPRVVLSGGVFMNRLIAEGLVAGLQERGFDVFLPCLIPMNDGGISFGQIYAVGGRPCASQCR